MPIVLNEKEYAEDHIKKHDLGKQAFFTISVLAKYYRLYFDINGKALENKLKDFVSLSHLKYENSKQYWDDMISKIVKQTKNRDLLEIENIWITESEMETISCIKGRQNKRLAFTLLCIAKFNIIKNPECNGWVNTKINDIFSMAHISCKRDEKYERLNTLKTYGLIEFPQKPDKINIRVKFIDSDSKNILRVFDFRDLGYEYEKFNGENFVRCHECGRLIKGNKNGTRKYCNDCAGYTARKKKIIICENCGKEFLVPAKNNRTKKCEDCLQKKIKK